MPIPDNPILTLSKALARLADFETPLELTPSTREFFETLAKTSGPSLSDTLNILLNSKDPTLVGEVFGLVPEVDLSVTDGLGRLAGQLGLSP